MEVERLLIKNSDCAIIRVSTLLIESRGSCKSAVNPLTPTVAI